MQFNLSNVFQDSGNDNVVKLPVIRGMSESGGKMEARGQNIVKM